MGRSADATICFGVYLDTEGLEANEFFESMEDIDELEDFLFEHTFESDKFFDSTSTGSDDCGGTVLFVRGTRTLASYEPERFDPHELAKGTEALKQAWAEEIAKLEKFKPTDLLKHPQWLLVPYYG